MENESQSDLAQFISASLDKHYQLGVENGLRHAIVDALSLATERKSTYIDVFKLEAVLRSRITKGHND